MRLARRRRKSKTSETRKYDLAARALDVRDLFVPDGLEVGFDELHLGEARCRVYALHALPRRLTVGWLDECLQAGDVDVSVHIEPVNDNDVSRDLAAKENKALSHLDLDRQRGVVKRLSQLEAQAADYRALREAVQLGQDRLFNVTTTLAVHAESADDLRSRSHAATNPLARRGVRPRALALRQLEGLQTVLPLGNNKVEDHAKNLTSGAAACCLPLAASQGGHASGAVVGINLYTRAPVLLDRFAGERVISNQHMFICGEPGSGKSVTLRTLSLLEAYRGVRTAYVDPEGEYVYYTKSLGGQVVHLRPGGFSGMNPLDVDVEEDDQGRRYVNIQDKMGDLHGLVAALYRYQSAQGLDVRETALLEDALRQEYAARGITSDPASLYEGGIRKPMPTLSDVQARLAKTPGAERLADAMKPLLKDGSLGFFDGQTTLRLADAPFICFNLKGLGGDFARFIGVYAVLTWLLTGFALRGGKKHPKNIAVDEAWMFLRHPDAAAHLENIARRGRKYGCALTIATHRFEEFTATKEGRAVIESCASLLVMKQEDHAAEAVVEYFKLAGGCRDLLAQARPGQGILRVSGSTTAVQVQPAPHEWPFVETRLGGAA
ncbi:MAG: hypothetical protein QMC81_11585 [Thermoanaerobacterales bacterium]|nr:hypothetical protein [Thermoanaerobacterales bacterium]